MRTAEAVRAQGEACAALGSPMYAELCARVADDVEAGGPAAEVLAGIDLPGPDAVALRLLGSVHRLVLERRAGALAAWYPSVGGRWEPEGGWAAFRAVLVDRGAEVREGLGNPPQTNEIARGAALVGALARLPDPCRLPVRLHEIGASAGLLLRADRVRYVGDDGSSLGPADAAVTVPGAWADGSALRPWDVQVVDRRGCDQRPVDATTAEGRTLLASYCWPDQQDRWERLRGALDLARAVPASVERRDAADFVDELDLREGAVTVLWHSVVWQYLPAGTRARLDARIGALSASATAAAPFVHVSLEPRRRDGGWPFVVRMRASWGEGSVESDLGVAAAHGVPVEWTRR